MTSEGWVRSDGSLRPHGSIESWQYQVRRSARSSAERVAVTCVWIDDSVPRNKRDQLRRRFGLPFQEQPKRNLSYSTPF